MKMAESIQSITLKKNHPEVKIESVEVYFIDKKMYVNMNFLSKYFNVTPRTVINWQDRGLIHSDFSLKNLKLFAFEATIEWVDRNINKTKAKGGKKSKSEMIDEAQKIEINEHSPEAHKDIDKVSEAEADRRLKIIKNKIEEMKLKELEGELVRAEDLDIAQAEQAVIHVAQYMNDKKLLPSLIEMKPRDDISKTLDELYQDRIENAHAIISKVCDIPITLYDLIQKLLENLAKGVKMSVIEKALEQEIDLFTPKNKEKKK